MRPKNHFPKLLISFNNLRWFLRRVPGSADSGKDGNASLHAWLRFSRRFLNLLLHLALGVVDPFLCIAQQLLCLVFNVLTLGPCEARDRGLFRVFARMSFTYLLRLRAFDKVFCSPGRALVGRNKTRRRINLIRYNPVWRGREALAPKLWPQRQGPLHESS